MYQISLLIALLLIGFILVVVAIIGTSFLFTEGIKEISRRFSLSQTFVGASILSIATSFPEFINAIVAGVYDKMKGTSGGGAAAATDNHLFALDSFYNLSGANMLQNVFLALVTLFLGVRLCAKKKDDETFLEFNSFIIRKKYVLWGLIVSETALMLITLLCGSAFTFGGISITPIICVVVWVSYVYLSARNTKDEIEVNPETSNNWLRKLNNKKFFSIAIPIWVFFALISYANFYLITRLTEELKIPNNVSLGFLLGLITSIPEFSSFFFLFKKKNYELATAGLFGSSLFNLCLPLLTNLINPNWFMSQLGGEHKKVLLWLITDLSINLLLFTAAHKAKTIRRPIVASSILVAIYLSSLIGISFL